MIVDMLARLRSAKGSATLTADQKADYTRLLKSCMVEAETGLETSNPTDALDNIRELLDKYWPERGPTGGRFA